jgi:hypothetical protein
VFAKTIVAVGLWHLFLYQKLLLIGVSGLIEAVTLNVGLPALRHRTASPVGSPGGTGIQRSAQHEFDGVVEHSHVSDDRAQ